MSAMWGRSQGLDRTVIEDVALAEVGSVVISVRPRAGERERCGNCHEAVPVPRQRRWPPALAWAGLRGGEGLCRGRRAAGCVP